MEPNTNKQPKRPNYPARRAVAALALTAGLAGTVGAAKALQPKTKTVYAPVSDESWQGRSDVADNLREQGAPVSDVRQIPLDPGDSKTITQVGMTYRTDPIGRFVQSALPPEAFDASSVNTAGQAGTQQGDASNVASGK